MEIQVLDLNSEDHYEGEVNAQGLPNGEGYLIHTHCYSAGNYTYRGHFRNGLFDGHGVMSQGEDDVYDGQWRDGKRHGHGRQTYCFGDRYEGEWKDDEHHGHGKLTKRDGTVYEGPLFDHGVLTGHGTVTYPDGGRYEGSLRGAKRHGHGTMTYADGTTCSGQWLNDNPFDEEALLREAAFTPEKLETFGQVESSHTHEYKDLDVEEGYVVAGFTVDGHPRGFIWRRDWDDGPGSRDWCYCGLRDPQGGLYSFLCSLRYHPDGPSGGLQQSDYMSPNLLEKENGRIVFCGVHRDGVRHGLGSEFSYVGDKIIEQQGLWQNGRLTHRRDGGKLVPLP